MSSEPVSSTLGVVVLAALVVLGALHAWKRWRLDNWKHLPLPPGPPALPVLGNLLNFPTETPWKSYTSMSDTYGDIIHLSALGRTVIVLSSLQSISDLLDKRAAIYSDGVHSTMLSLMGFDWLFPIWPYGERWRKARRALHTYLNANTVVEYQAVQLQKTHAFLRHLLETPDDLPRHIRHVFAATIMNIMYGINVRDTNDQYVDIAEEALNGINASLELGRFYVDFIPSLRYIPAWLPGAQFQRQATYWKEYATLMHNKPFDAAKKSLSNGTASPSVAAAMLENMTDHLNRKEEEDIARSCTAVSYAGGSETTTSVVHTFFLAMVLHPEVQKNAQLELDTVLGHSRLPDFSDRPSLPYVEAILKEVFRWQPVGPLGFPHQTSADDIYRGYLIPKGSIVMPNVWAIMHDPVIYPNPHVFDPERFISDGKLNPDILDPIALGFGFGRRSCPGQVLALPSLFCIVSSVLCSFNINPALDESGIPIPVSPRMSSTVISHPLPFSCSLKPRSAAAEVLILESS